MVKKSCFVSKKSGSIPEWNFVKINIAAEWFNSRMEFGSPLVQVRPRQLSPIRIKRLRKEREEGPEEYIRQRRPHFDKKS